MAKIPAMVTEVAIADGRDRATVEHVARVIREAGYITTGKRGGGAVEVTTREAVNLIIALNGADDPKGGALAIDRFRSLTQWAIIGKGSKGSAQLEKYNDYPETIQDVMNCHTFGEALEALVDGIPNLISALHRYAHDAYTQLTPESIDKLFLTGLRADLFGVEIIFERYAASIELFTMQQFERRVEFKTQFMQDANRLESGFYGERKGDRRVKVSIGIMTLVAAWQVLNPDKRLPELPDYPPLTAEESED